MSGFAPTPNDFPTIFTGECPECSRLLQQYSRLALKHSTAALQLTDMVGRDPGKFLLLSDRCRDARRLSEEAGRLFEQHQTEHSSGPSTH